HLPLIDEVKKLPAFPTVLWQLEPHQSGLLPVAADRGGPLKISWEIHGDGPIKVAFICGLGFFKSSYQRQTMHFGHVHGDKYSMLILDNRGMGRSDCPLMRYSTSEMARDAIELFDHVGWTSPRQINLCGLSMGGMISQEIACLIPDRLCTLNLFCTAAAIENTTTFTENMMNRIMMLLPKSLDRSVQYAAKNIYAPGFPEQPDNSTLPDSSTPRVKPPPGGGEYLMFATNYERFAALEAYKQADPGFTKKGFLMQLVAAGWHHKSPAQLKEMADKVGRERILVLHGTQDGMISLPHGKKLIEYIQPAVGHIVEGMGHAPIIEKSAWLHELLEERFAEGEKLNGGVSA
ncbi:glycylpeptide N-tetradecanoyltransferase, partial [Pseudomassariella vexata]